MKGEDATLELLDRKMAELASFLSPGEIFRALLEGATAGAPKTSVFLLRDGRFKGWSSIGYPADAARRQRDTSLPSDDGWLAALAAEEDVRWRSLVHGETAPAFGQPPAAEVVGLPLRVSGKTVAILVAERDAGETPWSPAALAVLCQAARLRLELDLAWRRLKSRDAAVTTAPAERPPEPVAVVEEPVVASVAAAAVPAAAATALAPWGGVAASGPAENDPRREEARRYARLVATDIRLYNEEAVVLGRRQRDLTSRLAEHLKRGRESFTRRFPDLGAEGAKLLDDAYVHVLGGGDPTLFS
ncbi:MAG TPA: hypothetical protein VFV19_11950 [Candidatus Polarisedimenticolaceae bacterium]|nr:hypothetical protein [Candidatus Polarisedimenticolaceae bacterium]